MTAAGVRPQGMVALGFCPVCGADLLKLEPHAATCNEDGFVEADAELSRLRAAMVDAYDDVQTARRRRNARNMAAIQRKYDDLETRCIAREQLLRESFHKRSPTT